MAPQVPDQIGSLLKEGWIHNHKFPTCHIVVKCMCACIFTLIKKKKIELT